MTIKSIWDSIADYCSAHWPEGGLGGGGLLLLLIAFKLFRGTIRWVLILIALGLVAGAVCWYLRHR